MARIYVSSTFNDLKECRELVRLQLRKMGHEDVAMEYYVAESQRPLTKCLNDVASCDLYIGIFAWRYGYIPPGQEKSITELEYRKAFDIGKDRLIFLLHEDASWPAKFVGKGNDALKIEAFRNELSKEHLVSFFKSPQELTSLVATAVHNWEKKHGGVPQNNDTTEDQNVDFSINSIDIRRFIIIPPEVNPELVEKLRKEAESVGFEINPIANSKIHFTLDKFDVTPEGRVPRSLNRHSEQ